MLQQFILLIIIFPLIGFIINFFVPERNEKLISTLSFGIVLSHFALTIAFTIYTVVMRLLPLNIYEFTIVKTGHYSFFIDFYYDTASMVFLLIGSMLTSMVTTYSRYYLHREEGFKRFFLTILFFFFGYNLVIVSGNFETLFLGWEIIGISSFLLIGFYRTRYLPVKNSFKVYSIYRIGDVGIILAMWACHHFFHENITFARLYDSDLILSLSHFSWIATFIGLCIACAAAVKSAQYPFSFWLPRAMEGPTPSSAIFYGSLSVHLGVFLMLRTYPLWEHQYAIKVAIIIMGLVTSLVASVIARVQSSIKSQVAYSSISQIGIIMIEVAMGWHIMALIHFAGNAFLRTYQLLASPSVVSYMIREQFYNFKKSEKTIEDTLPKKVEYGLYLLALKEFNMEQIINMLLWKPLKKVGRSLNFLNEKKLILFLVPIYVLGLVTYIYQRHIPTPIISSLPTVYSFIGLALVFKAFTERRSVKIAWALITINYFWIALAIAFNDKITMLELAIFLSGIVIAFTAGIMTIFLLKRVERVVILNQYLGHVYEHPKYALAFLLATLGLTGFPITSTFVGIDLVFSHIEHTQVILSFFVASSFVVSGIAGVRIYTRLFLGPHFKTYHAAPYKSA